MSVAGNIHRLLAELPPGVELVAAVKGRSAADITAAIDAGVEAIGENYIQEAEEHAASVPRRVSRHFIGGLQRNKVKIAARLFDMIETVDSLPLAQALDRQCAALGKVMPVLIEINSGCEPQKSGVLPENAGALLGQMACLNSIHIMGLMTMGPRTGDPEQARPYFTAPRRLFEEFSRLKLPGMSMKYLSMGMTNSYLVAIQEGANMVRLGSKIFDGSV